MGQQPKVTSIEAAAEIDVAASISIAMRTRLMLTWAEIAIEHERRARDARRQIEDEHAAGSETLNMNPELHASMVSVSAAAHSLDALYAELAELVGPETLAEWSRARRGGRWAEVAAILDLSFNVDVTAWRDGLRRLYEELRNPAVHPKAKARPLAKHPALHVNVAAERAVYSCEAATEAVDLLLEILSACVAAPRLPFEQWAADARGPIEGLRGLRAATASA